MDKVLKLPAYNPQTPTFSDVSADDWYDQAVEAAVYAGIVKGYGDTTFRPGNHITREELACGLVQAMGQQDEAEASMSAKTSFTDDAGISGLGQGLRGGGGQGRPAQGLSGRQLQAAWRCHQGGSLRHDRKLLKAPGGLVSLGGRGIR